MNIHNSNINHRDEQQDDMKSFKVKSTVRKADIHQDTERKVKTGAYNYCENDQNENDQHIKFSGQ